MYIKGGRGIKKRKKREGGWVGGWRRGGGEKKIRSESAHRSTEARLLRDDASAPALDHAVDASRFDLGGDDLHEVERLYETRRRCEYACVRHAAHDGEDLSSAAVDGVSV